MQRFRAAAPTAVPMFDGPLPAVDSSRPPWPGQQRTVAGVRLHVRDTPGPLGAQELAVYVHGLGGSSQNWTDLAALLGTRMPGLGLDLPGFGRSEPLDGYDYRVETAAAALTRFLAGLERGPVHLLGNSMGGAISLLVAARAPRLVRTLTLVSPAVPDLRPDPRRAADIRLLLAFLPLVGRPAQRSLARLSPRQRAEQVVRLCFAHPERVPENRLAEVEAEFVERSRMSWSRTALGGSWMGLLRAWVTTRSRSLWAAAGRVQVPALVIWGTEDRLVSVRKAPRTAAALPRGRLLLLPRAGHVAQLEQPETVARAVLGMLDAVEAGTW